jgi:hypothetical protein
VRIDPLAGLRYVLDIEVDQLGAAQGAGKPNNQQRAVAGGLQPIEVIVGFDRAQDLD